MSGSPIVNYGSMAVASLRRTDMSLSALRRGVEKRILTRDVAVWIGRISAGWSVETRDSSILVTLASAVESVEIDDISAIEQNCR